MLADNLLERLVPHATASAVECDWVCYEDRGWCKICFYQNHTAVGPCYYNSPNCFPR